MPEAQRVEGTVTIEDARIIFRNFTGLEGDFNRAGDRNFVVLLPPVIAQQMQEDGWNIKYLDPREEGDEPQPCVQVSVGYKVMPPRVVMITSKNRTDLREDMIDLLDAADIIKADIIIRPYNWEVRGNRGVKAYLKTMFVTIQEDELELKYAQGPEEG